MPPFSLLHLRKLSQSTSIPKKLQRVRDHSFDSITDLHKKTRVAIKLQRLLLPHPNSSLPISHLLSLSRRLLHLPPATLSSFLLRHPHLFHLFDHPVHRLLWLRLSPPALAQLRQESSAVLSHLPRATLNLRKLLLLASPSHRLRLEHLRLLAPDLALPEDFEHSVVLANPSSFRLSASPDDPATKFVEAIATPDDRAAIKPAIEATRESQYRAGGSNAEEDSRFAFPINFPPGFKIGKYYRIAVWKWQRLPYWSPYEDVSGYDMRSLEARRRLEKRAVATVHEILSLTVEGKTTLERIAQFRQAMGLPKKLKEFLLQHQGIFYVSTRGNQGKLHTVFLREGYRKGEMVEPNEVYLARRRLGELLLMSPKKANVDRMLTSMGRFEQESSDYDSGVESHYVD